MMAVKEMKKALASSTVKLAARDVEMSYTIIYCVALVPFLWITYAVLLYIFSGFSLMTIILFLIASPLFSFLAVKGSEQGVLAYRDLVPLVMRLGAVQRREQDTLPERRALLQAKVRKAVRAFGPRLG